MRSMDLHQKLDKIEEEIDAVYQNIQDSWTQDVELDEEESVHVLYRGLKEISDVLVLRIQKNEIVVEDGEGERFEIQFQQLNIEDKLTIIDLINQ